MEILERLKSVIAYSRLSDRSFAIKCGIKQPTLDKQLKGLRSVSLDVVLSVMQNFPEISAEWMLRSEGDMLNSKIQGNESTDRLMKLVDTITTLQEVVNTQKDTITMLKERNAQLENQLKLK